MNLDDIWQGDPACAFKLGRLLERHRNTPILESFGEMNSRRKWMRWHDRKVMPHERPRAIVLWRHFDWQWEGTQIVGSNEIKWTKEKVEVIKPVTVFAMDQTKPYRKHGRTKAFERFWEIFGRYSHAEYRLPYSTPEGPRHWKGKVSEGDLKEHLAGQMDYALRMSKYTRFIAIDLDLHAGRGCPRCS